MLKGILTCLAALVLLAAAPSGALAQGVDGAARDGKVLARLKRARDEDRRVIILLRDGVDITGRVGELRERGFTFEPDNGDDADVLKGMGMVAGVLYEDVVGVRRPSKLKKFFRGLRIGVVGAGAFFIVMPVYGVQALLGNLPDC